jgi:hypothetical protein
MGANGIEATTQEDVGYRLPQPTRVAAEGVARLIRIHRDGGCLSRATKRRTVATSPPGRDTNRTWVYSVNWTGAGKCV